MGIKMMKTFFAIFAVITAFGLGGCIHTATYGPDAGAHWTHRYEGADLR